MEKKLVLFDWNGTLLDDVPFFWSAFEDTFREFGGEPPSMKEFFQELERDYYGIYTSRGITASREELNEVYAPLYADLVEDVVLYSHVAETLEILSDLNIPTGLITMQQEDLVLPILTAHGILDYFSCMSFHDLQKAETITAFCEEGQVVPGNCFFVGDTPSDIRHASQAGVNSVAFMNGYVPKNLIAEADPDFAIREIGDVVELVLQGSYRGTLCGGCNVPGNHERNRCQQGDTHILAQDKPVGQQCSCQTCRTAGIIFGS